MTAGHRQFTFTHAEFMQIRSYIAARDEGQDSGWYYGDKKQFEKRHSLLRERFSLPATASGEQK